jgi:GxxExxY protein
VGKRDAENLLPSQRSLMSSVDTISGHVVDAAFRIHRQLGPGLMESVYEALLVSSLTRRSLHVESQKSVSFDFDGMHFENACRVDLLVEGKVVVELKSVERLAPVHSKQLLTYLRVMNLNVGLLINFGAATFKAGVQRIVNDYQPAHVAPLPIPLID